MYRPFDELTRFSFHHACTEAGVTLSAEDEERVMAAYNGLGSFPDADRALDALSSRPQLEAWVFSNGTKSMVSSSLVSSPSLSGPATAAGILCNDGKEQHRIVSIDDQLKVYKPDPRTYKQMVEAGGAARAGNVWLVSSNPFDALGAVAAGMQSAWVDRAGSGWVDGLAGALGMKPTVVVKGVDEAIEEILKRC
jgi:2-haloacid dehalogenase